MKVLIGEVWVEGDPSGQGLSDFGDVTAMNDKLKPFFEKDGVLKRGRLYSIPLKDTRIELWGIFKKRSGKFVMATQYPEELKDMDETWNKEFAGTVIRKCWLAKKLAA